MNLLKPIEDKLQKWWPAMVGDSPRAATLREPTAADIRFWSHEWTKHGTCSGLTQHDYFNDTLGLLNTWMDNVRCCASMNGP